MNSFISFFRLHVSFFLTFLFCLSIQLDAGSAMPAKLLALFPKGAMDLKNSEIAKMDFMMQVSCTASLKSTRGCIEGQVFHHALRFEIKAYDVNNEIGSMQAEMIPLTSAEQLAVMREQLEKKRGYWKGLNVGRFTSIKEEKLGKGILLMIGYDALCADVNPDRPEFHEIKAMAYFFNGRTEATVELENRCSDAEAREVIAHILQKIDQTDFKELM